MCSRTVGYRTLCTCATCLAWLALTSGAPGAQDDSLDRDYGAELPRIAPTEPADALGAFQVQPGFRLELVASEPLVFDPIAMAFDEFGRLYVVEMQGYSEDDQLNLGVIRLLEDIDGDGNFDKSTAYLENLSWPTAVACFDGGILVGVAPDILYCKDTDGDGRADVTEVVFTGFGRQNVQGLLNSFRWSIDNHIHGAASSNGAHVTSNRWPKTKSKPLVLRGRDFAIDPRTMRMAATSGGGQHGLTFDRWGNKFVCSNSDHIQFICIEDRYLARNPWLAVSRARESIAVDGPSADVFRASPVEPWRIVRTRLRVKGLVKGPIEGGGTAAGYFTSATGITMYGGDAYPGEYLQCAFIGDVGGNLVHRKIVEPRGITKRAKRANKQSEFIASTDIWFRPVQFTNSPSGVLYMADMYREVIEHPLSLPPIIKKHLDLTSGRRRGRIYRIVPDGFREPKRLLPGHATEHQLVSMLEHPNDWHRETAARLLYERQATHLRPHVEALAVKSNLPEGRIRALHVLHALGQMHAPTLLSSLSDDHPRVREHAVRLSEELIEDSAAIRAKLYGMVDDKDVGVRYQLALTLGHAPVDDRVEAMVALTRRDIHRHWMRIALQSSLSRGAEGFFLQLLDDNEFRDTKTSMKFLVELAGQLGSDPNSNLAPIVDRLITLNDQRDPVSRALLSNIVQACARRGRKSSLGLDSGGNEQLNRVVSELVQHARQTVVDKQLPHKQRIEAIPALSLSEFNQVQSELSQLLSPREPLSIQLQAIETLQLYSDDQAADILLDSWSQLSPTCRSRVLDALMSRRSWMHRLLDRVQHGKFLPRDIDLARAQVLMQIDDASVAQRAKNLLAADRVSNDRTHVVQEYRQSLTLTGDSERGRQAFRKQCAGCHRLEGFGHELGPNLATMRNRGAETILVNVLDPNREMESKYATYVMHTDDGRILSGMIESESATSLTLLRADDARDTVLRTQVDEVQNTGKSLMPEGMEQQIDKQTMADVIAYIISLD